MPTPVKPVPDGYRTITPYLVIKGAAGAIEFYKRIFGAVEVMRLDGPHGRIGHAELRIGDAVIMLADEFPENDVRGPESFGGSPVSLLIYLPNVDAVVEAALAAGSVLSRPIEDKFYGDRSGTIVDPFGHTWTVATHIEDVSPEEMSRRAAAAVTA